MKLIVPQIRVLNPCRPLKTPARREDLPRLADWSYSFNYNGLPGHDFDALWLGLLGFRYAQAEHTVFQVGFDLAGIQWVG